MQLLDCYNKQGGSGCCSNEIIKGNYGRHSRSGWHSRLLAKCRMRRNWVQLDCYLS